MAGAIVLWSERGSRIATWWTPNCANCIEEGNVGPTLRCSHDPYAAPMPDAQGGIPTIMMEMLAYSRPGVIEVLPALPPSLVKGSMNGMLLRTFARLDKLAWDMDARTVDLTVTSARKQDVTLIARQGIEAISRLPARWRQRRGQGWPLAICICRKANRWRFI